MKNIFLTASALVLFLAPATRAQDASVLGAGTRVKLVIPTLNPVEQVGRIVSASRDTIVFRADAYPVTRALAVADVSSIEVSGGRDTHRGRDALYGLGIGGAAGALVGAATYKKPQPNSCFIFCETRSGDAIAGGFLGGIVGTLVGAFIVGIRDQTERWVPLHGSKIAIAPAAGGLGLSLSTSF